MSDGGTAHGPMIYGRPMKKSRVADVNKENKWPLETISGAVKPGEVAFHNASLPGGAQKRDQTKTECLSLTAPAAGNKFS